DGGKRAAERMPDRVEGRRLLLDGSGGGFASFDTFGRLSHRVARSLRNWTMLYPTSGRTARKRMTARALPRPMLYCSNACEYISLASTWVPKLPPVIVRMMSKIFNVVIITVVSTTISVLRIIGIVTQTNCR